MTTSRDVALTAGVSQTTVSRVLQGSPKVSPAARDRVLKAMANMNYRPNALARAMKTNRTGTIGVIVARITNPFYPQMLDSLARMLADTGHRTVIWDADAGGEIAAVDALVGGLVDGLIHAAVTKPSTPLSRLLDSGAPVVLINRTLASYSCDQVSSDNARGARQVAEYFLLNDRRRIGFICGPQSISTFRDRERGFRTGLRKQDKPLPSRYFIRVGPASYHAGNVAMRSLLQAGSLPDAIFCANDALAFGAMDAARSAGVRIGQDLWLVGYDDVDMASWDAFDLTTVRQPIDAMARKAVSLLLARLEQAVRPHENHRLSGVFVVRGSSARALPDSSGLRAPLPFLVA